MIEIYNQIDEKELAKYYAAVLVYNFPESIWYEKSYNLINNIKDESDNEKNWFKKYNPVKILYKKQKEENFEIQRIS